MKHFLLSGLLLLVLLTFGCKRGITAKGSADAAPDFPSLELRASDGLPRTRTALVIGNSRYKQLQRLDACKNDAETMAATFRGIGIGLYEGKPFLDLTTDQMDAAIRGFARSLNGSSEAFIYYTGHGAQIGGSNYLLPVNYDAQYEAQAKRQAISLDAILDALEKTDSRLRVVILDACRDPGNLLPGEPLTKGGLHSKGLEKQRVDAPETLVCFATKDGSVSLADEKASFYSKVLAEEMVKPGTVENVLKVVGRRVYAETGQRQLPFTYGSLLQDHFFVTPATAIAPQSIVAARGPNPSTSEHNQVLNSVPSNPRTTPPKIAASVSSATARASSPPASGPQQAETARLDFPPRSATPTPTLRLPPAPVLDRSRISNGSLKLLRSFATGGELSVALAAPRLAITEFAAAKLYDLNSGQLIRTIAGDGGSDLRFITARLTGDGKYFTAVKESYPNAIVSIDAGTGKLISRSSQKGMDEQASISPDGTFVAFTSGDGTIKILSVKSGAVKIFKSSDKNTSFSNPFIAQDNKFLAANFHDLTGLLDAKGYLKPGAHIGSTTKIWRMDGKELFSINMDSQSAGFSPDGKRFVVIDRGGISLFDLETGATVKRLGSSVPFLCASFAPNGTFVAIGGESSGLSRRGNITLLDAITGELILEFSAHESHTKSIAVLHDSKRLVTSSDDTTDATKLWEIQ